MFPYKLFSFSQKEYRDADYFNMENDYIKKLLMTPGNWKLNIKATWGRILHLCLFLQSIARLVLKYTYFLVVESLVSYLVFPMIF